MEGAEMREFGSLGALGRFLEVAAAQALEQEATMRRAARVVEKAAKAKIRHYQDASGPFVGWGELADSTKADRVRLGYTENDPLLRSGALQAGITHAANPVLAVVGVLESSPVADIAEYSELGTAKQPPRSYLGGAAADKAEKVAEIIGEGVALALVGKAVHLGRMAIGD
jgi:phage gpG-like protein